ncbi:MAG: hypothetical protein WC497_03040 [Patescibacteria group bacterium]
MSALWAVHVQAGSELLAESQTTAEFCHAPRGDETQILNFRLKAGGWQRYSCRVVGIVNTGSRKEITVDILGEAEPSVV